MPAKLYSLVLSHPSQAARLILERKGIAHEIKDLFPGGHPVQLRLAGFRWGTVDLMARAQKPLAHAFARMADVSDERVRADIAALPAQLDHPFLPPEWLAATR